MKLFIFLCFINFAFADYWTDRKNFLKDEESHYLGHKISLTVKEEKVNEMLMASKKVELKEGFPHPEKFPPAIHFFLGKENIEKSPVFKFIQRMPKGGALHVHDTAMTTADYVVQNITYREHLYICQSEEGMQLLFANPPPQHECWEPLENLRAKASSEEDFDAWLRSKLSLETDKPHEKYPDINTVWKQFQSIFNRQTPMIAYAPVFEDYIYRGLQEFHADNVNYLELRGNMPNVYNLDGSILNKTKTLELLNKTAERFMKNNPDFLGIKYIYAPHRGVNNESMKEYLEEFKQMKSLFPDFLLGFDLVGQEDLGKPLVEFVNLLEKTSGDVKFYFHAGETNWNGMSTDLNLVDAILLNTTRIGHGFGVLKHLGVMEECKNRGIAVEVCPVSHQVLNLISDLRNHPASALLTQDFPLVISSDDPGLWGAKPLSHDFYEAFMGIASAQADLKFLKQLALNSLTYSSLNAQEKGDVILKFLKKWDSFIDEMYTIGGIDQ